MAVDDKKNSPALKNEAVVKKDAAAKKGGDQPKDKSTSDAALSNAEGGEKAATNSPSGYSRGEGQKPVSKAYKDNWNAIYGRKKKKKR